MAIPDKLRSLRESADGACAARAAAARCRAVAPALAALGVAAAPALAFADDFQSTVNNITDKGNSAMQVIGYGLLVLVAGCALVALAKEILPAVFAREPVEFKSHVKVLIVVIVLCVIAGFLPMLIGSFADLAGNGVDLGSGKVVKQ